MPSPCTAHGKLARSMNTCLSSSSTLLPWHTPKRTSSSCDNAFKPSFPCSKAFGLQAQIQCTRQICHFPYVWDGKHICWTIIDCLTVAGLIFVFCERKLKNSNYHSRLWQIHEMKHVQFSALGLPWTWYKLHKYQLLSWLWLLLLSRQHSNSSNSNIERST